MPDRKDYINQFWTRTRAPLPPPDAEQGEPTLTGSNPPHGCGAPVLPDAPAFSGAGALLFILGGFALGFSTAVLLGIYEMGVQP